MQCIKIQRFTASRNLLSMLTMHAQIRQPREDVSRGTKCQCSETLCKCAWNYSNNSHSSTATTFGVLTRVKRVGQGVLSSISQKSGGVKRLDALANSIHVNARQFHIECNALRYKGLQHLGTLWACWPCMPRYDSLEKIWVEAPSADALRLCVNALGILQTIHTLRLQRLSECLQESCV